MMNLINVLALDADQVYTCGQDLGFSFEGILPNIVSMVVTLIQIGVPLLLIIFGMIDLGKAVMQQKDDDIKKGQQTFFKRLIAAALVFFVIAIARLVFSVVGVDSNYLSCVDCFISAGGSCTPAGGN